ncbi:zinc ribbon domain-containing protein [Halomonas saccharevitans]|uniref:zinc ribbon domain-containing protein n=1 Tax=Halomonas saccharevitans TaxID=416872 RepID=UPI001113FD6E|nr:zinc ribbon domain-containing protein [Halomonas saccharevitans]
MSITECTECGGQVSTTAKACPHCGAKDYKDSFTFGILRRMIMYVAEHWGKYLPWPIIQIIMVLMLALYFIGFLNLPFIVGYGVLFADSYVDLPNIFLTWANWVVDIYIDIYSKVYTLIQSRL